MDMIAKRSNQSLQHYHPEEGIKKIVVAEAAEKYFAKAKDATQLIQAVEAKLTEQRKFVLWWDGQEKNEGGRPTKKPVSDRKRVSLDDLALDRLTVHRWRIRLKDEGKFESAKAMAKERCIRVCEATKGATDQRGASGTGENEWYTPKEYVEAAHDVLGQIDLDPASSVHAQEWIRAARFFTKEQDGLQQPWPGRVWLNPPYMQPDIAHFVEKLCSEVEAGRTSAAVMLTHNYTDTEWFHRAASACSAICFTRGRVAFIDVAGERAAPTQGQAFFYFGSDSERFSTRFKTLGFLVEPMR